MSKINNKVIIKHFISYLLVIVGSILLAMTNAFFMTELQIVSGGLSGIAIIVQHFVNLAFPGVQVIDIIVFALTWALWILGLMFLGKSFAFKTLISAVIYPLALSLFLRVPFFTDVAKTIAWGEVEGTKEVGRILLCGIFGGFGLGFSCALTFLGGGSTGGVDNICFILEKYLHIKQSISIMLMDSVVVILGMFIIPNNLVPGLCGIIAVALSALTIEFVYNRQLRAYQADIISDEWEKISTYAQDVLGRGATIISAKGGYKGDERTVLRVVFNRNQLLEFKEFIHQTDPHAFVTLTQTQAVYGEGFKLPKKK